MADYGLVPRSFWADNTGRKLKALGLEARVLAAYLLSCEARNLIGLYSLCADQAAHETGLPLVSIEPTAKQLDEVGFCKWDFRHEFVWVIEAAVTMLGNSGKAMSVNDLRLAAIARQLQAAARSPLALAFAEHYHTQIPLGREMVADLRARHGAPAPHAP